MHIDSYSFGHMVVEGKSYSNDVIISPEGIMANWFRREGHKLCLDDIHEHLKHPCERLIVGTGASGMVTILIDLKDYCAKHNIELIAHPTAKAVQAFNDSNAEKTVGAFHLTC